MSATPKINDQFWFDLSEGMVKNSIENINKSFVNVNTMIVWAFGIYTASSIFTVEYKKITEPTILISLLLPYLVLIIIYWISQVSQNPVDLSFDPRVPDQIKAAYEQSYKIKSGRLKVLTTSSFVAMVILALSLITAFYLKNDQKEKDLTQGNLSGVFDKVSNRLIVSGRFPSDSVLSIEIKSRLLDPLTKKELAQDTIFQVANTKEGVFYHTYNPPTNTTKITYMVTWNDNTLKRCLEKVFLK